MYLGSRDYIVLTALMCCYPHMLSDSRCACNTYENTNITIIHYAFGPPVHSNNSHTINKFHHSSFLAGEPTDFAGELQVHCAPSMLGCERFRVCAH